MIEEKHFFEKKVFSKTGYEFEFEPDKELIKEILKYKKKGKLLELGCGEGGTSLELAKRGFDVTCIDISATAINKIKKEARKKGILINAVCADLEDYQVEGGYDIIIGKGFLHFLSEKKVLRLIKECKKHTRRGGINIFEVMLEGDPSQEEDSQGHYFAKKELEDMYSDWEIVYYGEYEDYDEEEGWNSKLAKIIAIRKCKK